MKSPDAMAFVVEVSADKANLGPKSKVEVVTLEYARKLWQEMRYAATLANRAASPGVETSPVSTEAVERDSIIEECAGVCEQWPLSAENMNMVADRHGDWSAKLAGVCRADLPRAIRALKRQYAPLESK